MTTEKQQLLSDFEKEAQQIQPAITEIHSIAKLFGYNSEILYDMSLVQDKSINVVISKVIDGQLFVGTEQFTLETLKHLQETTTVSKVFQQIDNLKPSSLTQN